MANTNSGSNNVSFPYQKRSITKKGKAFMQRCVDAGVDMTVLNQDRGYRANRYNMIINYDLANGIIHEDEMYKITNPFGIPGLDREIQDYPLVRPRLNLLIGEESNRVFDFEVRAINEDAISEKEKNVKEEYIARLSEIVLSNEFDEDEAKAKLEELNKWKKYESQDLRERMGAQILNYLWENAGLKYKFNNGFEDALIAGEEVYRVDIVSGEPVVYRVNPLNLYVVRTNDSAFIDDSDIIVEDGYHNIGFIIDNYYEELSDADIDKIEKGSMYTDSPSRAGVTNWTESEPYSITDQQIEVDVGNKDLTAMRGSIDKPFDEDGRVRVTRVTWRSMRKVGEVTSYDDMGRIEKRYVDEFYKPAEDLGEEVKWMWINEWWEGTRIGKDIYVKMGPRKIQFRRFTNKSASSSGYVGTLYNVNSTMTKSLMDVMKPYQYLYNEFMDRVRQAFAKFKGPMIELDFAKMPEGWEPNKWMHYAENMGYLIVDSFKEGTKGSSQGKLAGVYNTTNKVINPDLGNYIQHHIMMLEYIEKQIGVISGIPDQRLGEIKTSETVGGVERAVTQSSHITETIFSLHDQTKLRVLETLLETAKYAYRNDKKKLQYVLDDMSMAIMDIDGEIINEAEFGIFATDGKKASELMQVMKQLAHAGLQNDKITFSGLLEIYTSPSISIMRRKIEEQEERALERQNESAKMQKEAQEQELQARQQAAQAELEQKERESIREAETKVAVALIGKEDSQEEDTSEVDAFQQKLAQDKLDLDRDKQKLAEKALEETKRSNKAKEAIARSKPKASTTTK